MLKPHKRIKGLEEIIFAKDFSATIIKKSDDGLIQLDFKKDHLEVLGLIQKYGTVPIPPYISKLSRETDKKDYQTCFAKHEGSVAAPTAGFHFTPELINKIKAMNVEIYEICLLVGGGTFLPLTEDILKSGKLHEEKYMISKDVLNLMTNRFKNYINKQSPSLGGGGRVIAVGTTVLRTLETVLVKLKNKIPQTENTWYSTDLLITNKHKFLSSDALITNFHLPNTSLLLLVSSFAGAERVEKTYQFAQEKNYSFYSYGDSSLLHLNQDD